MPLLWARDSEQFMFKRIDVEKGFANSEIRCIYKKVWDTCGSAQGTGFADTTDIMSFHTNRI